MLFFGLGEISRNLSLLEFRWMVLLNTFLPRVFLFLFPFDNLIGTDKCIILPPFISSPRCVCLTANPSTVEITLDCVT